MPPVPPLYSAADYLAGLQRLLPTGPIWPREPGSTQAQVLLPLVAVYARNVLRANALLQDAFPVTPVELLPEWQATLGLPDPCAGTAPTLDVAQSQVAARFLATGGQSTGYFIDLAAALGYTVTITSYAPFRASRSTAGQPVASAAWSNAWLISAPQFTIDYFRAGQGSAGEPLASWQNTVLQCELQRVAPAHTTLIFSYS